MGPRVDRLDRLPDRLTDRQPPPPKPTPTQNTLIILTSNLGAEYLSALPADEPAVAARHEVMQAVRAAFSPEWINRLDDIVLFNRLRREDMDRIVERQVDGVRALLAERGLGLTVDPAVVHTLADLGYDPSYGARPLKRTMQAAVLNPLATLLLEGKAKQDDLLHLVKLSREAVRPEKGEVVVYGGGDGGEWEETREVERLVMGKDVLVCRVEKGAAGAGLEGGGGGEGEKGENGEGEGQGQRVAAV